MHLPPLYIKLIDKIICQKDYPCTSEFIRVAIRKMLKRDIALLTQSNLEKSLKEVHTFLPNQKTLARQKKLDQFKILLCQDSTTQKRLRSLPESSPNKQTRIE
ncbi:MAG: ribbon-helix-helix domain-containing protein [Candidatus Helarchaeota archaeon]